VFLKRIGEIRKRRIMILDKYIGLWPLIIALDYGMRPFGLYVAPRELVRHYAFLLKDVYINVFIIIDIEK